MRRRPVVCDLQFKRRELLVGIGAVVAGAVLPIKAMAQDPLTVGVALGLASAVLDMMKSSGDLERELQAINLKLDRILENQQVLIRALGEIDGKLTDIQKQVSSVPSETLGLQLVVESRQLVRAISLAIRNVKERPNETRAKEIYLSTRDDLFRSTGLVLAAVQESERPPGLIAAAKDHLTALIVLERHEAEFGATLSESDAGRLKEMVRNTLWSLQEMAGPKGVAVRLQDTTNRIDKSIIAIKTNPVMLETVRDDDFGNRSIAPVGSSSKLTGYLCALAYGGPNIAEVPKSTMDFVTDVFVAFGGRKLYNTVVHNRRDVEHHTVMIVAPVIVDSPSRTDGCRNLAPFNENGWPSVLIELKGLLDTYNALAAIETRLLAFQKVAADAAVQAQSLNDRLTKKAGK
ncbi:hypothetical protein ACYG9R_06630 [Mesorhizobium sp. RSR565B]|uniref:hypothetical protein n=1 Tax=Mesorhizobium sp. L103C565B0 TaxID=1287094 RepID=UPI0004CF560A|nr:hypothetical protein [Mesorhizobium sp. L103C565B0]